MDIEILTIGDEILTGHTVDSNSAYIAARLLDIGLTVKYISSTGDAVDQMEEAFRTALSRAQLIITTGGLGPTDDDNTKKGIVKVFKRNLIFHEEVLTDIKARYAHRGIEMPAINQNQALLPQGATFFPNRYGSAVGLCITESGRTFISLPGVPREMQQIINDEVIPYLSKLNKEQTIKVIKLRTTGIVESKIAELIKPGLKLEPGVRLAYLPTYSGVDLRIIAADQSHDVATEKAHELSRYLEQIVGKFIYGKNNDTLEETVGQLLVDNDRTLATAESCTAGSLSAIITSVAGASNYFLGGVVAYANDIKQSLLNIDERIITDHGAVSEECAIAMAQGVREATGAEYALSITGIAGPDGGSEEKPVGTTFIGLASMHTTVARKFLFGTSREANRIRASYAALEMLRREILDIQ